MFTGLVENVGTVTRAEGASPRRLSLETTLPLAETRIGDSIAIDGCCLTVVACDAARHEVVFEAATETLRRTTLGSLAPGARVHLERALRFGDRLGGHLVAGHVDGIGTLRHREQQESALYLRIEAPADVARLTAPRGSITVAGVSLTVTDVAATVFSVALIPHTLSATTLGELTVGAAVNLEADLVARYIERLLPPSLTRPTPGHETSL